MEVQTNDLESIAVSIAGEIGEQLGYRGPLIRDELLKFQSLIKSVLGTRFDEAFTDIVARSKTQPIDLQSELLTTLNQF